MSVSIPFSTLHIEAFLVQFPRWISIPLAQLDFVPIVRPAWSWSLAAADLPKTSIVYRLILTGAADGVADLVLPMSSFQSRLRNGTPSYLSAVIPNGAAYVDEIAARLNGDLVVSKGFRLSSGAIQYQEISRAALETVAEDTGSRSSSVTLTGHRTETYTSAKTVAVSDIVYRRTTDGRRKVRAGVNLFLRPGDTVRLPDLSEFVAGYLVFSVTELSAFMEIEEV